LNAWSNSALGKGVQFFSLYNLATNLSSLKTWAEWTVLPAAKVGALSVLSNISSAVGGTEISSVIAGTTTTVTAAPVASGIAASESVGASVAPYGIAAATVLDMNASAGCMGMNGDSYFSSGQVGVFWWPRKEATMIALCMFGTDAIASFLRGHAVLLALAVSGLWLFAAFDYSRKGNSVGTFGWGGGWRTLSFSRSEPSHKGGWPILPRSLRKGGLPRTSTVGPGVEFFRHGETCPLPAMRLFSLSDLQLLSQAGAVDA